MGVLEIKCPFNHAYYYQVQAQIKFCSTNYCDFVVWGEKKVFIDRIYLDDNFISNALEKATLFFKVGVMPKIVGKWYSNTLVQISTNHIATLTEPVGEESGDMEKILWCYCKGKEDGEMIACEHRNCPIVWFRTTCLKLLSTLQKNVNYNICKLMPDTEGF